ncbi:ACT domain-containing protein, partial [Acidomonas methanolica]
PGLPPRLGTGSLGTRSSGSGGAGAVLTGVGPGIATHFAGCCHPLPGDPIVGIIAQGKGITIHTRDCHNLGSFAASPERFLEIDWDYEVLARDNAGAPHVGRVSVVAVNEPAVLATLTNTASKHHGSVLNLKIVNRQLDFMEILVDLEVRDLRHLATLIAALRAAQGVMQVERAKG